MSDADTEISPDDLAVNAGAEHVLAERDQALAAAVVRAQLNETRRLAKRYADETRNRLGKAFIEMLCSKEIRDRHHPRHTEALKDLARARCRYRAAGGKPVKNHHEDLLDPAELLALCEQPRIFVCLRNQDYEGAVAAWNESPFHLARD